MTAPTREQQGLDWISAHIFHAGDLDALITGVAAPLVTDLAPAGFFFLRYWEGGPHLRLRLRPAEPAHAAQVTGELARRAGQYLRAHPSAPDITPDQYARLAARRAAGERLASHDSRLHANDTVELIAYQPEYHAYGNQVCMDAVERHFTESSRLALTVLSGQVLPGQRAAATFAALTITLAACQADPARLPSAELPAAAADSYRDSREDLHREARALWHSAAGHPLAAWSHSVHALRDRLTDAGCAPEDPGSPAAFLAGAVPAAGRPVADVLLRCTHLFSNRIGLAPAAEYRIVLLTARILSELAAKGEIR